MKEEAQGMNWERRAWWKKGEEGGREEAVGVQDSDKWRAKGSYTNTVTVR